MPVQLNVPDGATQYLNEPAAEEFRVAMERHAQELLGEAGRLEATSKSTKGNPEITSTMIKDADLLLRRGYSPKRKKPLLIGSQLVAAVGAFATGFLFDAEKLKEPVTLVVFVVLLTVTITATVVTVLKD